ncbi:hypothetical protein LJC56_02880 [Christensenellaceae bacterium OttesenSCG-928-K19]|nr:hypothetical protein [Christensenellaceae bacterium OttesenSCG-928-K19]
MAKSSTMESAYKVLAALLQSENGMSERELRRKFLFLDIDAIIPKLEAPGYISHRITGYKVRGRKGTEINHDYNDRWYPTDLGITALEQYKDGLPPAGSKIPIIVLAAVSAACVFILYLISRPTV